MLWIRRCLALAHFLWGGLLLLCGISVGVSMLRILPHLSSGTVWTNLPGVLLVAASYALPPGSLGFWMLVLGRWTWTARQRLRLALLITHGPLLMLGTLAVVVGVHAMHAAERSTASGGGIMSPLAALPLLFGIPVLVLALCAIAVALVMPPSTQENVAEP
jgi:hypothetical protein